MSLQQHNARRRKGQAGSARSLARQTRGKRKTGRKAAAAAAAGGGAEGSGGSGAALGRSKAHSVSSQEQLSGGSTGTTATPSKQQASSGAVAAASGLQPPWCTPSPRRTPSFFHAASEEQPGDSAAQLQELYGHRQRHCLALTCNQKGHVGWWVAFLGPATLGRPGHARP